MKRGLKKAIHWRKGQPDTELTGEQMRLFKELFPVNHERVLKIFGKKKP